MPCLPSDVPFLRFAVNKLAESLDEKKLKSLENRKKQLLTPRLEKLRYITEDLDLFSACSLLFKEMARTFV